MLISIKRNSLIKAFENYTKNNEGYNKEELEKIKQKALEEHIPIIMDDTLEVIEKYLKKINLLDNVMYLDMKDYLNDENYLDSLNKVLKLKENSEIRSLPAVVFYKNGVVEYVSNSKKGYLEKNVFKNYIDQNGLAS